MAQNSVVPHRPAAATTTSSAATADAAPVAKPESEHSILKLGVKSKSALYSAFMPFIKGGGLFIPTRHEHPIGEEVRVILMLLDEPRPIPFTGKVCWVSPATSGRFQKGLGVSFPMDESGRSLQRKCEEILGVHLSSSRDTLTV